MGDLDWAARLRCRDCRFWETLDGLARSVGFCRRHPPQAVRNEDNEWDSVWPETLGADWCGEAQPRLRQQAASEA